MSNRFCTLVVLTVFLLSCQRDPVDPTPPDTNPPIPTDTSSFEGMVYSTHYDTLIALDIKQEKIVWKTPAKVSDLNEFIYHDSTLYIAYPTCVTAVDAGTGVVKWEKKTTMYTGYNAFSFRCRPVIKDTLLYSVMSGNYSSPTLYCLDKRSGREIWKKDLSVIGTPEYWYTTPVVVGDKVVGIAYNNDNPFNMITCFNRFTGEKTWYNGTIASRNLPGYPFSPDSTQVIFLAGYNGEEFNSLDINTGQLLWRASSPFGISTLLAIPQQDNRIIFPGYTMKNAGIFNPATKTVEKTAVTDEMLQFTAHKENIYYTTFFYKLAALNTETSKELWRTELRSKPIWDSIGAAGAGLDFLHTSFMSNPTADDNYVYFFEAINTPLKKILNSLYLFDARTGEVKKEIKIPGSDPVLGRHLLVVRKGKAFYTATRHRF